MAVDRTDKILNPDIIYVHGDAVVPSKSLAYKIDPVTKAPIEKTTAKTHKFENELNRDLKKELSGVGLFPTEKNVMVSITHGIHAKDEYDKCDLDNRAKTILDALKQAVYIDDSQVQIMWCDKKLIESQESYYRISVKILDEASLKILDDTILKIA